MMHQVLIKQADGQWLWETSKHGFTCEEVTKAYTPYVRNYYGRIAIILNRYNQLVSTIQWDDGRLTTRMLGYDYLDKLKRANLMIQERFYREREQEQPAKPEWLETEFSTYTAEQQSNWYAKMRKHFKSFEIKEGKECLKRLSGVRSVKSNS